MLILRIEGGLYTLNVRGVQTQILERAAVEPITGSSASRCRRARADTSVTVMDVMARDRPHAAADWVDALGGQHPDPGAGEGATD